MKPYMKSQIFVQTVKLYIISKQHSSSGNISTPLYKHFYFHATTKIMSFAKYPIIFIFTKTDHLLSVPPLYLAYNNIPLTLVLYDQNV